jgi:hypothetical protein
MKCFLTIGLLILHCASCSQNRDSNNTASEHEVKIILIDTLDLENSFWQINRFLEKENPEHFKNPPDYSDTTNEYYVTHYIKRYNVTVAGRTNELKKFCVPKSDTSKFKSFFENQNLAKFFTPDSYFAFMFEKRKCLDLFLLTNESVSFKKSDITYFALERSSFGTSIAVKLTSEAGKHLKDFSKNHIGQEVAFMIDGVIYYSAKIAAPLDNNVFAIYPDLSADEINGLLFSSK